MRHGALLCGLLGLALGCSEQRAASSAPEQAAGGAELAPPAAVEHKTTNGSIALSNLEAQIAAAEEALELGDSPGLQSRTLLELYAARVRFRGSFSDFTLMQARASFLVTEDPGAESLIARAGFWSAVHEFAAARRDLTAAAELEDVDVQAELFAIEVATFGQAEAALSYQRQLAEAYPSFRTLSTLATFEAALGQFAEADAHYLAAAEVYRDVSPLPLAWLAFARGVMWAEHADQPEFARVLYGEAVERVPDYVVAHVHLAELEDQSGDRESAIARLTRIAELTEDPEPAGYLAELLLATDAERSAHYAALARSRYEALLAAYPLAFADHASEFFAGPVGADPARAVQLALLNLEQRLTPRAYLIALQASLAAGQTPLTCELAAAARAVALYSANLEHALAEISC
jgi:hypothetical protein